MGKNATPPSESSSSSGSDEFRKYRSRRRGFVMDAFDEVLLTYLVRETFSSACIIDSSNTKDGQWVCRFCETLAHGGWMKTLCIPKYEMGVAGSQQSPKDVLMDAGWQDFIHRRSGWSFGDCVTSRWPFDFPYLENGQLSALWYLDDPLAPPIVRKVMHLLTRVTTARAKHLYPGHEGHDIEAHSYRFGHHALLWCSRNPGSIIGDRFRPADAWTVPKSKWYRSLWDRVIADYGEDFADPHLRGPLVQFVGPLPWGGDA